MKPLDHIDAIAIGIETLGFEIGVTHERRAKASMIEQALRLAGYRIVKAEGHQGEALGHEPLNPPSGGSKIQPA